MCVAQSEGPVEQVILWIGGLVAAKTHPRPEIRPPHLQRGLPVRHSFEHGVVGIVDGGPTHILKARVSQETCQAIRYRSREATGVI